MSGLRAVGHLPVVDLVVRGVVRGARSLVWRVRDYAYVLRWQAAAVLDRGAHDAYLDPPEPVGRAVVLIPGVYESWQFLRPLAKALHRAGHPVHVLPALGYNRAPIPASAEILARYLVEHDLRDAVLVAHSKGGLIGKRAMLVGETALLDDPASRIAAMVAINTPFEGSVYARFVPLAAVRAFVPGNETLLALAAEEAVNSRITSVYSRFDPHVPAGSVLEGATNVEVRTPGHFRALADPDVERLVLEVVRRP